MNKKIIILNGAARKNGSTVKLVEAFADGAENLSWKNLGEVLGKGKTKEAYQLGASI